MSIKKQQPCFPGPVRPDDLQDLGRADVAERVRRPRAGNAEVPEAALGGDKVVLAEVLPRVPPLHGAVHVVHRHVHRSAARARQRRGGVDGPHPAGLLGRGSARPVDDDHVPARVEHLPRQRRQRQRAPGLARPRRPHREPARRAAPRALQQRPRLRRRVAVPRLVYGHRAAGLATPGEEDLARGGGVLGDVCDEGGGGARAGVDRGEREELRGEAEHQQPARRAGRDEGSEQGELLGGQRTHPGPVAPGAAFPRRDALVHAGVGGVGDVQQLDEGERADDDDDDGHQLLRGGGHHPAPAAARMHLTAWLLALSFSYLWCSSDFLKSLSSLMRSGFCSLSLSQIPDPRPAAVPGSCPLFWMGLILVTWPLVP
jgi:hypothetical protein